MTDILICFRFEVKYILILVTHLGMQKSPLSTGRTDVFADIDNEMAVDCC